MTSRHYTLLDADRQSYESLTPGAWGGHRRSRIYGRLDCPTALLAIARGGYVEIAPHLRHPADPGPHARPGLGQAVTAHVVPTDPDHWEELVAALKAQLPTRLAKYKIPSPSDRSITSREARKQACRPTERQTRRHLVSNHADLGRSGDQCASWAQRLPDARQRGFMCDHLPWLC